MGRWARLPSTLRFLWQHPIAGRDRPRTTARWLAWQLGSRLLAGPVAVPFVDGTRLFVAPGVTAATANFYVGLAEFAEMSFALHLLGPRDLFVDVGANVGAYTVLASGVRQAQCVALEPSPRTFARLRDNLALNRIEHLVDARNVGAAAVAGELPFTVGLDAVDHVLAPGESAPSALAPMCPLDEVLADRQPTLIKIDVEGWEDSVLAGAGRTLASPSLLAIIIELNDSSRAYGGSQQGTDLILRARGFRPYRYLPFDRRLLALDGPDRSDNTIYVRSLEDVEHRIRQAPRLRIHGVEL